MKNKEDKQGIIIIIILALACLSLLIYTKEEYTKNNTKECVGFIKDEYITNSDCYIYKEKYYCKKNGKTIKVDEFNCSLED